MTTQKSKKMNFFIGAFSLFLLMITSEVHAVKYIKGNSHFNSKDGDSLTFIKSQLLSKAREKIIDKELAAMGHDKELFWETFNSKFDDYFEPILEKLKVKMGIDQDDEKIVSEKTKKKYFKILRYKKLKLRSRFGRLDKMIKSYAIEKLSRSSEFPNSRYMKVKAIVNRKKLNKLYFKFIRTDENMSFGNLFLSINLKLKGVGWSDFGVEVEKDIKDVIAEHWKRWLEDHLKTSISNIIISDEDETRKLEERFKMPMTDISKTVTTLSETEEFLGLI